MRGWPIERGQSTPLYPSGFRLPIGTNAIMKTNPTICPSNSLLLYLSRAPVTQAGDPPFSLALGIHPP